MKNRIFRKKIILLAVLLAIFGGMLYAGSKKGYNKDVYSPQFVPMDEVWGELSFSTYKSMEWEKKIPSDTDYLTQKTARAILQILGLEEYIKISNGREKSALSRAQWKEIYIQILDYLDTENEVIEKKILLMDTIESHEGCILVTNQGEFPSVYKQNYLPEWETFEIYIINGKCVGIAQISMEEATVENTYVKSAENNILSFLFRGAQYDIQTSSMDKGLKEGVADLVFLKGQLKTVRQKENQISGNLLSYDKNMIEIEGYGRLSHAEQMPVYQLTEGAQVTESSISRVILGNMEVSYVIGEDKVCAILMKAPAVIENIRVLLLADGNQKFRPEVYLMADTDAVLKCGDTISDYVPGTVVRAGEWLKNDQETLSLQPKTETGKIVLCDENGNALTNGYSGSMEVRHYEEGYTTVNSVPFETYLTAVVPSEMPSSYEKEALKAQAVCARSYAYMQLMRADLAAYGAHINDSTSYQVYNKVPAGEASIQAVKETENEVLTYNEQVIEAYYFSTSMGYTDTAEIWNPEQIESYGYLKKVCLNQPDMNLNLSDESAFLDYITSAQTGYDSEIKFYRWNAEADFTGKEEEIRGILENRHSISPRNVLYYESDGKTGRDSMDGFGKLKEITTEKRSASGSVLSLNLSYENGMVKVLSEYNIRKILGTGVEKITYQDGSETEEVTILPSAACSISRQKDGAYIFYGGGYGHGIGMSQNGANGLAKTGMGYQEILNFFYKDIKIEHLGNM